MGHPRQDRSSPLRSKVPPKSLLPTPDETPRNALHRDSSVTVTGGLSNWHRRPKASASSTAPGKRKGRGPGMGLESTPAKPRQMKRGKGKSLGAHSTPLTSRPTTALAPGGSETSLPPSSLPSSGDFLTPSPAPSFARSISSPSLPSIRPLAPTQADVFGDKAFLPHLSAGNLAFRKDSPSPERARAAPGGGWDTSGIAASFDDIDVFHSFAPEDEEDVKGSIPEVEITDEEMERIMILDEIVPMPFTSESEIPLASDQLEETENTMMRVRDYTVPLPPDDTTHAAAAEEEGETTPRAESHRPWRSSSRGGGKSSGGGSKIKSRQVTPYRTKSSRINRDDTQSERYYTANETLQPPPSKHATQSTRETAKRQIKRRDDPFAPSPEFVDTPATRPPLDSPSLLVASPIAPHGDTQTGPPPSVDLAIADDEYEPLPHYIPSSHPPNGYAPNSLTHYSDHSDLESLDLFGFRPTLKLVPSPAVQPFEASSPIFPITWSPVSQLDIPTRSPSLLSDRSSDHPDGDHTIASFPKATGPRWREGAWRGAEVMRRMESGRQKTRFRLSDAASSKRETTSPGEEKVAAPSRIRELDKTILTPEEKKHRENMADFFIELESFVLQVEEVWT